VGALLSIPFIRFALYPLFARTTDTSLSEVGPIDSFSNVSAPVQKIITVAQRDGWRESIAQKPVYVVKDAQGQLQVFSTVCPHLGCEVPWNAEKQQFFCPCHGSAFAGDGTRIAGPTPRGLDSLPTTVQNGRLMVRYQYFRQLAPDKEVVG
jgi:Rieske Fe-S protein